ncbi:MAG: hypothetical protein IT243_07060 [Bacteroidia bacterium]|nr:hypothetical protein [Bacteroidia bacterium]
MKNEFEFQEKLVKQIKATVPSHIAIAEELAELLNLSSDSIYRRLRCQSFFSFDEVALISKKYGISLDNFINLDSLQVLFNFNPMYDEKSNFEKYLLWFSEYLTKLAQSKETHITYVSEDVPLFRHFKYNTLSAFKSFYWNKAVLNNTSLIGKKFHQKIVSDKIIELNKKTIESYYKINSTEIWNEETLKSTLKQVEFFWESDQFESAEQALYVLNEIREMIDDLKHECENSYKDFENNQGKLNFYVSEVMIGNNCVLVDFGNEMDSSRVFLSHNTFNSISTYNSAFVLETRQWMENIKRKSILISGSAEKQRAIFFKKNYDMINSLEKIITGNT